ncbi:MAG: DUF2892 domain-containing protein [Bdellovibrionaceae bacterium]|nr:DUF2892 domain-containing protein [Pseudobdellovibrionaceae bacterium]
MKCNVALWDRILRFFIGVGLAAYLIAGGPIWVAGGIYFLFTSAWGFCPLYATFKIQTLREEKRPPRINPFEEQSQ